jgi:hypothetical protein
MLSHPAGATPVNLHWQDEVLVSKLIGYKSYCGDNFSYGRG